MDQRKAPGDEAHLVGLKVADQVPLRVLYVVHLPQRLLDAVLAEAGEAGGERLAARAGAEALRDGDDRDVVRVAPGARDPLAHGAEVGLDRQRTAMIAPNRRPSASRRCEGRYAVSLVQRPRVWISWTPASCSCARLAAARSRRNFWEDELGVEK